MLAMMLGILYQLNPPKYDKEMSYLCNSSDWSFTVSKSQNNFFSVRYLEIFVNSTDALTQQPRVSDLHMILSMSLLWLMSNKLFQDRDQIFLVSSSCFKLGI